MQGAHYLQRKSDVNPPAKRTPIFTLAPELQSALKQPFLPHWTDSVPLPLIANVNEPGSFADNDYYSTRLCGFFNKKLPRSKRMPLVPAATEEDGNRIIPIKKATMLEPKKSSFLNFAMQGEAMPSLRKLAKLWKSSCTSSSARIAPERNASPQRTPQVTNQPLAPNHTPPEQIHVPELEYMNSIQALFAGSR